MRWCRRQDAFHHDQFFRIGEEFRWPARSSLLDPTYYLGKNIFFPPAKMFWEPQLTRDWFIRWEQEFQSLNIFLFALEKNIVSSAKRRWLRLGQLVAMDIPFIEPFAWALEHNPVKTSEQRMNRLCLGDEGLEQWLETSGEQFGYCLVIDIAESNSLKWRTLAPPLSCLFPQFPSWIGRSTQRTRQGLVPFPS